MGVDLRKCPFEAYSQLGSSAISCFVNGISEIEHLIVVPGEQTNLIRKKKMKFGLQDKLGITLYNIPLNARAVYAPLENPKRETLSPGLARIERLERIAVKNLGPSRTGSCASGMHIY